MLRLLQDSASNLSVLVNLLIKSGQFCFRSLFDSLKNISNQ